MLQPESGNLAGSGPQSSSGPPEHMSANERDDPAEPGRRYGRRRGDPLEDVLIGLVEQALQRLQFLPVEAIQDTVDEAIQQHVELLHPAPATPARPLDPQPPGHMPTRRVVQKLLATIIFLMPAIAFAGFNPFGQAVVQFMMVWQR